MASSSLRVLVISHAYVVGVNQGKLNAIAKTDKVTVGLFAPSNWKALEWNRLLELEKPYPNIQIYSAPVFFTGRGGAHFYAPWQIWQVLHNFRPDIVQVEEEVFSLCTFELAIWSRFTGKPLVVFGWENMDRKLSLLRCWIRRFVLNTASLIIAGNQEGGDLLKLWGYKGTIEVMPQIGVDTTLFAPQSGEHNHDEFQIGFLGRLVPEKGIDILLAAVAKLRHKGLICRIILCGLGTEETALRQKAEKLQIADSVIWRGAVPHDQAPMEMNKFDVLVLPSRTIDTWKEQFGHVLIEAMAMGIPVVGSTCGEIPNVIARSDLVFEEEDTEGLAAILERMISNPLWRQEIKQYCWDRVHQNYSHEKIAERLITLWQSVLQQQSSSTQELSNSKQNEIGGKECV
ncbi:glycosyltransferase [Calothrix sp. UHCC 0171]|uniref:glycosyltransferase n=1 Tax=Calothrix sp. UHCC 0171 TaxID=3110245 RepID=UPI002B1E94D4|nr:glycosyltransferase [Calothrix sp. UHCC 0171]MEA5573568.1 glycosyltransferase [Calothrix sp. UHCC 0171]